MERGSSRTGRAREDSRSLEGPRSTRLRRRNAWRFLPSTHGTERDVPRSAPTPVRARHNDRDVMSLPRVMANRRHRCKRQGTPAFEGGWCDRGDGMRATRSAPRHDRIAPRFGPANAVVNGSEPPPRCPTFGQSFAFRTEAASAPRPGRCAGGSAVRVDGEWPRARRRPGGAGGGRGQPIAAVGMAGWASSHICSRRYECSMRRCISVFMNSRFHDGMSAICCILWE